MSAPPRPSPVRVRHARGEYPVHVAPGLLDRLPAIAAEVLPRRRLALIADTAVAGRVPGLEATRLTVVGEEASKSRTEWARLSDELLEHGFGRDSALIALGGGVTGDLAGFVAATFHRGIPWIQVPTTLLAMLDASVGGKTGVDTPHGKNLVGAFHQPAAVLIDPLILDTLPERAFRAGLAEAVKHGVIADAAYFAWLSADAQAIGRRDPAALARLIHRSVEIKAEVVAEDETELGRRAILNAGHTVAHAIEAVSGYAVPHGEAVAMGLVAECRLAERLGAAPAGLAEEVATVLRRLDLPTSVPRDFGRDALLAVMRRDKKNRGAEIRFALPNGLGSCAPRAGDWTVSASEEAILMSL